MHPDGSGEPRKRAQGRTTIVRPTSGLDDRNDHRPMPMRASDMVATSPYTDPQVASPRSAKIADSHVARVRVRRSRPMSAFEEWTLEGLCTHFEFVHREMHDHCFAWVLGAGA